MDESVEIWILTLRAFSAGALAATAAGVLRSRVSTPIRIAIALTFLSGLCYLLYISGLLQLAYEPVFGTTLILGLLSYPVVGLAWLFVMTVFEDMRVTPLSLIPAFVMFALFFASENLLEIARPAATAGNIVAAGLCLHGLFVIGRGFRGDLVESRRRLRAPLFGLLAFALGYILWLLTLPYVSWTPGALWRIDLANALCETAFTVTAAAVLLEGRAGLLSPPPQRATDDRAADTDRRALTRLKVLMEQEEVWRQEGLTIGALASEVGVGEQRLRRLINRDLGHRNFAAFVNAYRIDAAKQRLADPNEGRTTVAQIAFELGFTSLGPFNRAFKDLVGQTPTEWRRHAA